MELYGLLDINDFGQFILKNVDSGVINVTGILDEIYNPDSLKDSQVEVKVFKGDKLLFDEDGALVKKIDTDGINSYHICGNNLDLLLSNYTEENLAIDINKRGNSLKYGNIS